MRGLSIVFCRYTHGSPKEELHLFPVDSETSALHCRPVNISYLEGRFEMPFERVSPVPTTPLEEESTWPAYGGGHVTGTLTFILEGEGLLGRRLEDWG